MIVVFNIKKSAPR